MITLCQPVNLKNRDRNVNNVSSKNNRKKILKNFKEYLQSSDHYPGSHGPKK